MSDGYAHRSQSAGRAARRPTPTRHRSLPVPVTSMDSQDWRGPALSDLESECAVVRAATRSSLLLAWCGSPPPSDGSPSKGRAPPPTGSAPPGRPSPVARARPAARPASSHPNAGTPTTRSASGAPPPCWTPSSRAATKAPFGPIPPTVPTRTHKALSSLKPRNKLP